MLASVPPPLMLATVYLVFSARNGECRVIAHDPGMVPLTPRKNPVANPADLAALIVVVSDVDASGPE
jgi:hypothetical protein